MPNFRGVEFWRAELARMLKEQIPEDLHLDYKHKESLIPPGKGGGGIDRQKRGEDISKDVSSFLNSDGGVLVYGVPEDEDRGTTRGSPIPVGPDIGFQRGEIAKETIENLITSYVQPRPGPDLFRVMEVPYGDEGRMVFVIQVVAGMGDVWQAADKRYYKRFQFKAEPMEHYEINMVRNRNVGPDLNLVFGVNDRWECMLSAREFYARRNEEVRIHIGIRNDANAVAQSALIELGVSPYSNDSIMGRIENGECPSGFTPGSFAIEGNRRAKWDSQRQEPGPAGVAVVWSRLFWNASNPGVSGAYAPIFRTETPWPVAVVDMKGIYHRHTSPQIAFCVWRLQAPGMMTKKGIVELRSSAISTAPYNHQVCITVEEKDWELT